MVIYRKQKGGMRCYSACLGVQLPRIIKVLCGPDKPADAVPLGDFRVTAALKSNVRVS